MAKKSTEKKQKIWYGIGSNSNCELDEILLGDNLQEAHKEYMDSMGDSDTLYAYKIELLGKVKKTITIVK